MANDPSGSLKPRALRCEGHRAPLGVDASQPRLSWKLSASAPAQRQTAWQIVVGADPGELAECQGTLWDSGRVPGDALSVRYAGLPLRSHQACHYRVRVWDAAGRPSPWSRIATWTVGVLERGFWERSAWIGCDARRAVSHATPQGELCLPPVPRLRTELDVRPGLRRALLYGTALGICDFEVDGTRVSEARFTPGWTDVRIRVPYRCWDVTSLLPAGAHRLEALLADGWYAGYLGWGHVRGRYGDAPRLRCVLRLEFADGRCEEIGSGPTWRARFAAIRHADFLMGESHDARADGADESADWLPVDVGAALTPRIEWHAGPEVVAFAEHAPIARSEPEPGVHVFDLGQNFAGVVRLRVHAPRGTTLTLRHAERLEADGTLHTANLRTALATDRYVCRGGGLEVWEPRFTYHGFRYVELRGFPGVPPDDVITGIALSSATERIGGFACSNALLERFAENVYQTQRANFVDVPTDCPQRDERLGWTGDAQIYVRTATLLCDVRAFFGKWLQDLADAQRADGQFPMVAPLAVVDDDGGPGWAEAGVIVPWELYRAYGDREQLAAWYPRMLRHVEFTERRSVDGVLPPAEYHCFGDWLADRAETPKELIYVAYYARAVQLTARVAHELGDPEQEARLRRLLERIRTAFVREFARDGGRLHGDTQCAYALALAFDLLPEAARSRAAAQLVDRVLERDAHPSTGFLGTKELLPVLSAIGRDDLAYRMLLQTTPPGWLFAVVHGATSVWERWDGWTPERGCADPKMNSFSHYAFGAVLRWVLEHAGGLRWRAAPQPELVIAPRPGGGLEHARVHFDSPAGRAWVEWERRGELLHVEALVPPGVPARCVPPPGHAPLGERPLTAGRHAWSWTERDPKD